MKAEKAKVYQEVKAAILRRYYVTEKTYRREFRQLKRRGGEPFQEVTSRLAYLLQQWTRDCSTADEVREVFVIKQLLSILPMEMRLGVQERKQPEPREAAGRLAEEYAEARAPASGGSQRVRTCFVGRKGGHMALDCPDRKTTNKVGRPNPDGRVLDTSRPVVKCYRCHQPGHIALHCPQNAWYCGPQGDGEILAAEYVDGLPVHDMVADTGCSRTLVHASLVPPHRRLREHMEVCCAHGDVTSQPLAEVDIELDGDFSPMVVGVAETLPLSVLLGRDFPGLPRLLATRPQEGWKEALLMMTRERKRREQAEAIRLASSMTATSKPLVDLSPDSELPTASGTQSSSSRVEQKRSGEEVPDGRGAELAGESGETAKPDPIPETEPLKASSEQLKEAQRKDETLQQVWRWANGDGPWEENVTFFIREGLLHRRWRPKGSDNGDCWTTEQLVLPESMRQDVMRLAHEIPLAGHMGKQKTTARILKRFYWPRIFSDVPEYVRHCSVCQRTARVTQTTVPMIPLPYVGVPFQRVATDVVGPLPKTPSGNRYNYFGRRRICNQLPRSCCNEVDGC